VPGRRLGQGAQALVGQEQGPAARIQSIT
jgi:hypothetical protein